MVMLYNRDDEVIATLRRSPLDNEDATCTIAGIIIIA